MLTGRPITVTITINGLDYSFDLAPSTAPTTTSPSRLTILARARSRREALAVSRAITSSVQRRMVVAEMSLPPAWSAARWSWHSTARTNTAIRSAGFDRHRSDRLQTPAQQVGDVGDGGRGQRQTALVDKGLGALSGLFVGIRRTIPTAVEGA